MIEVVYSSTLSTQTELHTMMIRGIKGKMESQKTHFKIKQQEKIKLQQYSTIMHIFLFFLSQMEGPTT